MLRHLKVSNDCRLRRYPVIGRLRKTLCADSHENDDFDTTTVSMLSFDFDSKGYGIKNSFVVVRMFVRIAPKFFLIEDIILK